MTLEELARAAFEGKVVYWRRAGFGEPAPESWDLHRAECIEEVRAVLLALADDIKQATGRAGTTHGGLLAATRLDNIIDEARDT